MTRTGVYVGNTITSELKLMVGTMNKTDRNLIIKNIHIRTERQNHYNIAQLKTIIIIIENKRFLKGLSFLPFLYRVTFKK